MHELRVDPEIFSVYPDYRTVIVYCSGLRNRCSCPETDLLLEAAVRKTKLDFQFARPAQHPHISRWREAYARFGAKPSRYHCSAEALLNRVLKDGFAPRVNAVVDAYNAISMIFAVPIGGEDRDKLNSQLKLALAVGGESFQCISAGNVVTELVDAGEVVWKDDLGVTCRRFNWRQCARTALTVETKNSYFVFDALAPLSLSVQLEAVSALIEAIGSISPGSSFDAVLVSNECHGGTPIHLG